MTEDPYRDPHLAGLPDGRDTDDDTGIGAAILLGALLLAAIGGFVYLYARGGDSVASNDIRPSVTQPATTGTTGPATTASRSATPEPEPASAQ